MIEQLSKPLGPMIDSRLSKPYRYGCNGPEEFYCLGLYVDLFREATGLFLDDPFQGGDHLGRLAQFYRQFLELPHRVVQPLDIIFYHRLGLPHISVVENENWAVTADMLSGVIRRRLADELRLAESVFRPKALLKT